MLLPPSAAARDQSRTQFFRQMDLSPGDIDIVIVCTPVAVGSAHYCVQYLAEVVKEQQAYEQQRTETPIIRLDYSSCQVFKKEVKR